MRRSNRLVAGLLIAALLCAIWLPGAASLVALFEVAWVLLPDLAPIAAFRATPPCDERTIPLLSLVSPRGPPPVA